MCKGTKTTTATRTPSKPEAGCGKQALKTIKLNQIALYLLSRTFQANMANYFQLQFSNSIASRCCPTKLTSQTTVTQQKMGLKSGHMQTFIKKKLFRGGPENLTKDETDHSGSSDAKRKTTLLYLGFVIDIIRKKILPMQQNFLYCEIRK